jgi:hypothetical protein
MKKEISINEKFVVTFIYDVETACRVNTELRRLNFNVRVNDLTEENKPEHYRLQEHKEARFWVDVNGLEEAALLKKVLSLITPAQH